MVIFYEIWNEHNVVVEIQKDIKYKERKNCKIIYE
jgi:hypothetical protein